MNLRNASTSRTATGMGWVFFVMSSKPRLLERQAQTKFALTMWDWWHK